MVWEFDVHMGSCDAINVGLNGVVYSLSGVVYSLSGVISIALVV